MKLSFSVHKPLQFTILHGMNRPVPLLRDVAVSIGLLTFCSANEVRAGDPLMLLPGFVEDVFHVALVEPEQINVARGYFGKQEPPEDREHRSNLWSPIRKYDPDITMSCKDFHQRSWNDWWDQGMRDGEITAFGYWNTPIHFVSRRGRNSIEGVIALDNRIATDEVVKNGKLSELVQSRIRKLRGGYHSGMLAWISGKEISVSMSDKCESFSIYNLNVE